MRWQKSRAQEAEALAVVIRIKHGVNSILLEETIELGLMDDQKMYRVQKFLGDLGFMHKGVSSHNLYVSYFDKPNDRIIITLMLHQHLICSCVYSLD